MHAAATAFAGAQAAARPSAVPRPPPDTVAAALAAGAVVRGLYYT
jgi:hypothetical protein